MLNCEGLYRGYTELCRGYILRHIGFRVIILLDPIVTLAGNFGIRQAVVRNRAKRDHEP